jgi:hypothetical protein
VKTQIHSKLEPGFLGIDYHKGYSAFCVVDSLGEVVERGRIEHALPPRT